MDAVDAEHSAIVICGGGDTVCSGIVVYGGGDIVLWCKMVKPVDAMDAVTQWMQWNSGIWWLGHCL